MKRIGLRARLGRLFAVQLAVIGVATVIGIYITQVIVEDILTRQALESEAEHYWQLFQTNPEQALPNTANMTGYLRPGNATMPAQLTSLVPGFGRQTIDGENLLVHVSDYQSNRLYLLFKGDQVSDLAFYFGIVPLSIVLLLMYIILLIAYRWSQRALSPVVRLANQLEAYDFSQPGGLKLNIEPPLSNVDHEVAALIDAIVQFTARLDAAIERERVFTRDAGHELRTPVAVFKGSLDLLEKETNRPTYELRALKRMRRTVDDMEGLLETLLLLARGEALSPPQQETNVNKVLRQLILDMHDLADQSANVVNLTENGELLVNVREKIVEIVLGNLLRNALTYTTKGTVKLSVASNGTVTIEDSGIGMTEDQLANAFEPFFRAEQSREITKGHGLGLSIVRRLASQQDWNIHIDSTPGKGTTVTVNFA